MSRSRRKTPKTGVCGGSEKKDKQAAHRKTRRYTKTALRDDPECATPPDHDREHTDRWLMNKDGKRRFNPKEWPEGMRK